MTSKHHAFKNEHGNIANIVFKFEDTDGSVINGSLYSDAYIYNSDRNFSHRLRECSGAYAVYLNELFEKYFHQNRN